MNRNQILESIVRSVLKARDAATPEEALELLRQETEEFFNLLSPDDPVFSEPEPVVGSYAKVVRDGQVGVVLSNDCYGWYTQHGEVELVFHPEVIKLIEAGRTTEINKTWLEELLGRPFNPEIFGDGDSDEALSEMYEDTLRVEWVAEGTEIYIDDLPGDDGYEQIIRVAQVKADTIVV